MTPLQSLKNRFLDPDSLWGYGEDETAVPFIVWDHNNDGQYEVSVGPKTKTHRYIYQYVDFDYDSLKSSKLPVIFGRTGVKEVGDKAFKIVTFWPSDRADYFAAVRNHNQDYQDDDGERFNQLIARQILPLLLREGVIDSTYRWFDTNSLYRGPVSRKSRKPKTPVMKFNMNGREYTYTELMGMLHSGDQQTRAMVMDFLCRSTEPQLKDVQSRLECNKPRPQMWTLPRKVDIGHQPGAVDFRSQKSLNRAWEAEMSRRVSRRRRLARRLLAEATDV